MKLKKIFCGILAVATMLCSAIAISACDVENLLPQNPGSQVENPNENEGEQTCEHVWGEWSVVTEATCTSTGEKVRVCTLDETHVETETIEALKHVFENYVSDDNATCLANATKTAVCEYGCETKDVVEIPDTKINHIFENYVWDNNATCTEDGTNTAFCEYGCETKDVVVVPDTKYGHAFENYVSDDNATCFADGTETAVCSRCLVATDTVTVTGSKLVHIFTNYVSDNNATCYADGTETAACSRGCGEKDVRTDEGSMVGHSFTKYIPDGNATCLEDGTKSAVCDYELCSEKETLDDEGSALGHNFYLGDCDRCDVMTALEITTEPVVGTFYYGESTKVVAGVATNEWGETLTQGTWVVTNVYQSAGSAVDSIAVDVEITFTPSDTRFAPTAITITGTVLAVAVYNGAYYASVDFALQAANAAGSGTVYVLPLTTDLDTGRARIAKTIATTTEIKSGVTLTVPFDETNEDTIISYVAVSGETYRTCSYGSPTYLKNQIFIADGHTIANAGTINVAGEVSGGMGGLYAVGKDYASSVTAGNHAQINLGNNAKLKNTGSINCYGFITETKKDNNSQLILEKGTTNVVFTIGEHRGASTYIGMIDPENSKVASALGSAAMSGIGGVGKYTPDTLQTSPFNRYYVASITTKLVVKYGATLKGLADLYADSTDNTTDVALIGSADSLITLTSSDSYVQAKYDYSNHKTDLDVFGDMALNPMRLTLRVTKSKSSITTTIEVSLTTGATGDSEGIFLPIPDYFDISLNAISATPVVVDATSQKIKLLPGAKLTVGENVTLNAKAIAVYKNNALFVGGVDTHYQTTTAAQLIVGGTLNVGDLGGKVKAVGESAVLNITRNNSVISQEMKTIVTGKTVEVPVSITSVSMSYSGVNYFTTSEATLTANGDLTTANAQTLEIGEYRAQNGKWYPVTVGVRLETNGGEVENKILTFDYGYDLTVGELPSPTRAYYEFLGWYTSPSLEEGSEFTNATLNSGLTLYAKWQQLQGKVLVEFQTANGSTSVDASATLNFVTQEMVGDVTKAVEPAKAADYAKDVTFARYVVGYYVDADATTEFDFTQEITESTTIYVKWADKYAVNVTLVQGDQGDSGLVGAGEAGKIPSVTVKVLETSGGTAYYTSSTINTVTTAVYFVIPNHWVNISGSNISSGSGNTQITENNQTITVKGSKGANGSSCVTADTLVTLADGTQKEIQYVTYQDMLLVWDFYNGEYTVMPASIVMNHGYANYTVVTLTFEDGTVVKTINGHGFFDKDENEFVIIDENNVAQYVGHSFVTQDVSKTVKLVSYSISEEYTESWSILTVGHYNCILEGLLTITPAEVEGSTKYLMPFELGEDMKYDEAQMQADIEKYGLYTYEDFKAYMTYEQFTALNLSIFKVSVAKGYITWEEILYLISIHI